MAGVELDVSSGHGMIVFDAISAITGGAVTYLYAFAKEASKDDGIRRKYIFLVTHSRHLEVLSKLNVNVVKVDEVYSPLERHIWYARHARRFIKDHNIALWYFSCGVPALIFPWNHCKTLMAFRNSQPFDKQEIVRLNRIKGKLRLYALRVLIARGANRCSALLFISEYGKQLLKGYVRVFENKKAQVIYHGIDSYLKQDRPLERNGSILYVSFLDTYKRQVEVVREYGKALDLCPDLPDLVFVGGGVREYETQVIDEIRRLGIEQKVKILPFISHQEAIEMMGSAKFGIFASVCENCPNILIEKLHAGLPLLVANREPMPEIAGDAAIYFDPDEVGSLSGAICEIQKSDELRFKLGAASCERAKKFVFENTFKQTVNFLDEILYGVPLT